MDREAARLRRLAAVRRAEKALETASTRTLQELRDLIGSQLRAGNYNPDVLSAQHPEWTHALEEYLLPSVTAAYIAGLAQEAARGTIDATAYAARHLDTVRNRLVGVADSAFDVIRGELTTGMLQGEDIPTLASRVTGVLSDEQLWHNRAVTIARTEAIGANNAGARDAARIHADRLGHDRATVVKVWLATADGRTRETHQEADGQEVEGVDGLFVVGGWDLEQPGDLNGPAEEVINCRCTVLYLMPGDPGYPDSLAASGGTVKPKTPVRNTGAPSTLTVRTGADSGGYSSSLTAAPAVVVADPPPADAPTAPAPDDNGEVRFPWSGVACPDGVKTGDGRKLTNVVWADLPMTLRAQFSEQMGHDDARIVGRIESIALDGTLVRFSGTWDDETLNPDAAEARRHNINGQMRGVSIDADEGTISFEDGDGNPIDSEALWDLGPEDEVVMVVDGPRIRAATVCMIPAFVEAYVADDTIPAADRPQESETITAATEQTGVGITAAALLAEPAVHADAAPASAFAYPGEVALSYDTGEPRGLTVTEDGRVFGYLATWGTCHIGIDGACVTPPHSASGYAHFLAGSYPTSDGQTIPVGVLSMDTGHAGLELTAHAAISHYDNTGTAAAWLNVGEDDRGIWFAGALDEDLPLPKRRLLQRTGKCSGDWRTLGGSLELVANLAVNVAGFPVPQPQARVASGVQTALVASAVVPGNPEPGHPDFDRAVGQAVGRHLRGRELSARLRRLKANALLDRLDRAGRNR